MRRFTAALTAALALAATSVAVAPTAHATSRMESHTSTVIEDGKVYVLFHDWDNLRPEDVQIRIRRWDSDEVLATVGIAGARDQDLCGADSDCDGGRFRSDPVVLPEVRGYTTDIVYREGSPDERIGRDRGDLAYGLNPRLALTTNHPTDSWEHPLQIIGSLTAEDPVTHEVKPMPEGTYAYRYEPFGFQWTRADGQGRFTSRPEFREGTEVSYTYRFWRTDESITVKRVRHDLKLTMAGGSTITAPAGSDIPFRGTVSATSESGVDKPLEGYNVLVGVNHKTYTAKDGSFAFMQNVGRDTSLTVGPQWTYMFNNEAQKKFALRLVPTEFVSLKAAVGKYRKVTITGKPEVAWGSYPAGTTAPMAVQYSSDGRTWKTVDSFTGRYGQAFSRTPQQRAPLTGTGYWRVRVTKAAQSSPTLKTTRKATQLSNDDLTPEGVKAGTQITAKGGLLQQSGTSWKAYAGQKVRVYFKGSAQGSAWEPIASTTTRADGTFSTKVTARRDGTWQIRYTDTPTTHYADYGREDYVDVR